MSTSIYCIGVGDKGRSRDNHPVP